MLMIKIMFAIMMTMMMLYKEHRWYPCAFIFPQHQSCTVCCAKSLYTAYIGRGQRGPSCTIPPQPPPPPPHPPNPTPPTPTPTPPHPYKHMFFSEPSVSCVRNKMLTVKILRFTTKSQLFSEGTLKTRITNKRADKILLWDLWPCNSVLCVPNDLYLVPNKKWMLYQSYQCTVEAK